MPSDAVKARKRSKTPTSKGRSISTNKAKKEAEEKAKKEAKEKAKEKAKKEAKDGGSGTSPPSWFGRVAVLVAVLAILAAVLLSNGSSDALNAIVDGAEREVVADAISKIKGGIFTSAATYLE
jgi:hypothetical protein